MTPLREYTETAGAKIRRFGGKQMANFKYLTCFAHAQTELVPVVSPVKQTPAP